MWFATTGVCGFLVPLVVSIAWAVGLGIAFALLSAKSARWGESHADRILRHGVCSRKVEELSGEAPKSH